MASVIFFIMILLACGDIPGGGEAAPGIGLRTSRPPIPFPTLIAVYVSWSRALSSNFQSKSFP